MAHRHMSQRVGATYRAAVAGRRMLQRGESGQTTVEYATVVALVAVVIALALSIVPSDPFGAFWTAIHSALS